MEQYDFLSVGQLAKYVTICKLDEDGNMKFLDQLEVECRQAEEERQQANTHRTYQTKLDPAYSNTSVTTTGSSDAVEPVDSSDYIEDDYSPGPIKCHHKVRAANRRHQFTSLILVRFSYTNVHQNVVHGKGA